MRQPILALLGLSIAVAAATPALATTMAASREIADAIADQRRPPADRARDQFRHPWQTLNFFAVRPGLTVIEFNPGGGWYTRILAPALAKSGHYVAAPSAGRGEEGARRLIEENRAWFGPRASVTAFDPTGARPLAPAGSVDRVLTFRNVHNLVMSGPGDGNAPAFFAAAFKALKRGGILGVVDHRLPEEMPSAQEKSSGYIKQSTIVRLATAAGFKLDAASPVNWNSKDTHDWPEGVWTLPPTLRLGEKDRAKYQAIGESDRLTLRFVKP
jgi:predicted methyltransferase